MKSISYFEHFVRFCFTALVVSVYSYLFPLYSESTTGIIVLVLSTSIALVIINIFMRIVWNK